MMPQLTLGLALRDAATFETFYAAGNETCYAFLQSFLTSPVQPTDVGVYLWGRSGSGKTHLLEACCHAATTRQQTVLYVPFNVAVSLSPAIFENSASLDCVLLDDVHLIAGHEHWEKALFHLYNQALQSGTRLIFSSEYSPQQISPSTPSADTPTIELPDLVSRLTQCTVFHLSELNEAGMAAALQNHAKARGFNLPEPTLQYLLRRYARNLKNLIGVLDTLDQASMVAKRVLTVPFVKSVLEKPKAS